MKTHIWLCTSLKRTIKFPRATPPAAFQPLRRVELVKGQLPILVRVLSSEHLRKCWSRQPAICWSKIDFSFYVSSLELSQDNEAVSVRIDCVEGCLGLFL